MSQCDQIHAHLKAGLTITSMQAFKIFAITRLPDRVRDLRNRGVTVYAEMIKLQSGKRVAQYSL
jgi:Helix-turn-helix domain